MIKQKLRKSDISIYAKTIANKILKTKCRFLLLNGQVGTGKTTIVRQILKTLGVNDDIKSPTFNIVNLYHSEKVNTIYHYDLYRLHSEADLEGIGFFEPMEGNNFLNSKQFLFIVEWPDLCRSYISESFIDIKISYLDDCKDKNCRSVETEYYPMKLD